MKPVETWAYALLLLVAVGLSWSSWTGEEVEEKKSAVVFDPGPSVTALTWDGEKNVARIAIEGADEDRAVWVEAGRRPRIEPEAPEPAASDDDDSAQPAAEPTPKPEPTYGEAEIKSFPGNDQAIKLVDAFLPLKALREFGAVDAPTAEGMGLDSPSATLEVTGPSGTVKLDIGDKAYGSSDTYVRDAASGTVYLVSSKVIGPLRGAESRLMERDLHPFEPVEVAAATLTTASGAETTALHQGRHDEDNAYWADPAEPEAVDTARDAVLDKVFQLRATSYPIASEAVADADVEIVARVSFADEAGKALGVLTVGRTLDAARSKPDEPVYEWYARSDRTRGQWVGVSRSTARELTDQLDSLLGG